MLFLLFKIGEDGYAFKGADIIEVLPYLTTKKISSVPEYIVGLANHRGEPIPVIDPGLVLNDEPCKALLSTRIILTCLTKNNNSTRIGIMAECATETVKIPAARQAEYENDGPLYFDNAIVGHTMFQLFTPRQVLPPDIDMTLNSIHRQTSGRTPL